MEYSDEILRHYRDPRNVGGLDAGADDVGTSMLGNRDCGMLMRLHIRVNRQKIIEDAKFKAYGCGCTIASASLLTELLIGKNLEDAGLINSEDIAEQLKLPANKIHCAILAEDLLKKAVLNYFEKQEHVLRQPA
jgi:nitrogen fixation NifU-like protein